VFCAECFFLAVVRGELDFPAGEQFSVALQRGDTRALEQHGNAIGAGLDDAGLALLHLGDVEVDAAHLDAVSAQFVPGLDEQLARFEQRLGGNAARVRAGAAEHGRAVLVLPLVDAGYLELVLRRANGRGITRRTAADDDHIVFIRHFRLRGEDALDPRGHP
jgi:hypothetical protein